MGDHFRIHCLKMVYLICPPFRLSTHFRTAPMQLLVAHIFLSEVLFAITATNTSLSCNGKKRIAKLCQRRAQQRHFVLS